MGVLIEFELVHAEVGHLINESAILGADGDMSNHRTITSSAVYERTSGLPVDASAVMWIRRCPSAVSATECRQ